MSVIAAVSVLFTITAVTVLVILLPDYSGPYQKDRIECPGMKDKNDCIMRGCVYDKVENGPACFLRKDTVGYIMTEVAPKQNGLAAKLRSKSRRTPYGPSIPIINVDVDYITENILRVKLYDPTVKRYEVPVQKEFPLLQKTKSVNLNRLSYQVDVSKVHQTFQYKVMRKDGTVLWDTSIGGLIMSDQYLQIASYLPSDYIFGIGEHVREHLRHDMKYKTWPLFSSDRSPERGRDQNLYGVHPFYTCLENSSRSHGVLFLNSNAMEVTLMPAPAISFRTVGGVLDLFYFVGDDPEHVIQLYTSLVGRPMMPPYWSLGFQLSRFGYNNLDAVKGVVERTRNAGIPLDVQYLDIDHFEERKGFTYDENNFFSLPEYVKETKEVYGLKWIPVINPGIAAAKNYGPYLSGLQHNVFIKRAPWWSKTMFPDEFRDQNVTFGTAWPREPIAFPDFFLENTKSWWVQMCMDYHKKLPFDGLWIDMNEPANSGTNYEEDDWAPKNGSWILDCPLSRYEDPMYNPLGKSGSPKLSSKTICMESRQGTLKEPYLHYDVHSLYGWSQTVATLEAAQKSTGTRSLVISRSTYPSSGRYCGHWLGNNKSNWKNLHDSVIGIQEFSLFGIPYIGASVCGFFENTNAELCGRWMQLGAYYTYFRNHNGYRFIEQDPVVFGKVVADISRKAVTRRYGLLPYLYTLFYRAHIDGRTVIRPVFHEFPHDKKTWEIDEQFMWGSCLLISPVLTEGMRVVNVYLPKGEWWNFDSENSTQEETSEGYVIKISDDVLPLHVRGGCILPTEDVQLRTPSKDEVRNITIYVYPYQFQATGEFFVDDGISKDTIKEKQYDLYKYQLRYCDFEIRREENTHYDGPQPILKQLVVFKIKSIFAVYIGTKKATFEYNKKTQVLIIDVYTEMDSLEIISWRNAGNICHPLY